MRNTYYAVGYIDKGNTEYIAEFVRDITMKNPDEYKYYNYA